MCKSISAISANYYGENEKKWLMGWKWWFGQFFENFRNSHHMIITIIRSKNHFSKFIFRQKFLTNFRAIFGEKIKKGPFLKADTITIGWRHNYYGSKFFVVQNRKPNFDHQKRLETTRKHHFSTRNYNFELFFRGSHRKFHEKMGF